MIVEMHKTILNMEGKIGQYLEGKTKKAIPFLGNSLGFG